MNDRVAAENRAVAAVRDDQFLPTTLRRLDARVTRACAESHRCGRDLVRLERRSAWWLGFAMAMAINAVVLALIALLVA